MRRIPKLLRQAAVSWSEDKAPRLGAALAYYTIFSIPPFLILVIGVAGIVFDEDTVRSRFVQTIANLVGPEGASAIHEMLGTTHRERNGGIATVVGLVTLVLGASGVFAHIKDALDTIWEVQPKPGLGLRSFARKYLFSVIVLLGTGFLLVVSLAVSTLLAAFGDTLSLWLPGGENLWGLVNALFSIAVVSVLFGLMYRHIPDARVPWRASLIGGLVTSLLFSMGQNVIGFYLGRTNVGSAFGAAGSLVVVLVWVYYSAMIFFFGAEFTKACATCDGARVEPEEDAMPVTEEARAHQGIPHPAAASERVGDS